MASPPTEHELEVRSSLPCKEFSEFKEALQQMRAIDDRIIYKLNTSVPTISFQDQVNARDQCKDLYEQLSMLYRTRSEAIKKCISESSGKVGELKSRRESGPDDPTTVKQLRKEQTKLRLMQSELVVEDVIRDRSIKVFKERCWKSYKPPDLD